VTAEVQGSRPKPYKVVVTVRALSREEWAKVGESLASQPLFVAKLLVGEMPQDIETAFESAGLSLFPDPERELQTHCSCPDWSNPCKHIAAVYYLLGEEFDRDPFLIFKLRGMPREELFDLLGGVARDFSPVSPAAQPSDTGLESRATPPSVEESLPLDPAQFWHAGSLPEDLFGEVRTPPVPAALIRRLRNFPFWRGEQPLLTVLEPLYAQASAVGLEAFLGEIPPEPET